MNESRTERLAWKGPIGVGNLPDQNGQPKLEKPHVYLTYQKYTGSTVVYVGQSKNLLNRLWEHYRNFLGLYYLIRREDGEKHYDPGKDHMFDVLNKLDEEFPTFLEDVKRLRICYAACEPEFLSPIESTLIRDVLDRFPYGINGASYWCDNSRHENYGHDKPIIIEMNLDGLEPEGKEILTNLFPQGALTGLP